MFSVALQIAEGVSFPYHVLGKAQLMVSPFTDSWVWLTPQADPYALFAQEYGMERKEAGNIEADWYEWVSQTMSHCPDDARKSLHHCPASLLLVAEKHLSDYLSRWPSIHEKLEQRLRAVISEPDLRSILDRNEHLFDLSYPAEGREIFYFNHFPTLATQRPGPHFVFGLGCLSRPAEHLLQSLESEVGLTLLARLFEDEQVCLSSDRIAPITTRDRYVQGRGSVLEALNEVIRVLEKHGDSASFQMILQKPGERGYGQLVESLYHHRHLFRQVGLGEFLRASLDAIVV